MCLVLETSESSAIDKNHSLYSFPVLYVIRVAFRVEFRKVTNIVTRRQLSARLGVL